MIIIPTYNEEHSIEKTIPLLEKMISISSRHEFLLLVYDSNSTDNTIPIVQSLQECFDNIILQIESQKSGLGAAYIKAMQYVIKNLNADIIFEFDADGSHQPCYIPVMIDAIENGADVAIGSRYVFGGKIDTNWIWYRRLISRLGNWVARFMLVWKYKDLTSGFRATKVSLLRKVALDKLLSKNYAYKLHLFWELFQLGGNIIEVPITFIDRKHDISKFPKNNILESLKVVMILRLRALKSLLKKTRGLTSNEFAQK